MEHVTKTLRYGAMPRHVAIVMDGNGRWARARRLPRIAGHRSGVEAVREAVRGCIQHGVPYLTLFAFSSENWQRPAEEVALLMELFAGTLGSEIEELHRHGVRLRVIGERARFGAQLERLIAAGERRTACNDRLTLTIAASYGGRWDIVQAVARVAAERADAPITEADIERHLATAGTPDPDLLIRTGGERRLSNFLLWQLAYTELYFTDLLWPDFDRVALEAALFWYSGRERRFGRTGDQLEEERSAAERTGRAAALGG